MDFDLSQLNTSEQNIEAVLELVSEQAVERYKAKMAPIGEEWQKKIEAYVYLQIIDQSWKEHLRAMDQLQDNVKLRGYGQRDPLQEYKKEAFQLFESLMIRIEDETAQALVRMPPPELVTEDLRPEAPDESQMAFNHPEANLSYAPKESNGAFDDGNGRSRQESDDHLIYHGSRSAPSSQAKAAPFIREDKKVGRNDLCPCGSGLKFKKCHGRTNSPQPSL